MFQQILVPLDGSRRAEQGLPAAARLARASGGGLVLLRAVFTPQETIPYAGAGVIMPETAQSIVDVTIDDAKDYLRRVAASDLFANIQVQSEASVGEAASTILSAAEKYKTDLIVMCSHGFTGLKRWVMGSVAEKVSHHSPVPVLMLREHGLPLAGSEPRATRPMIVLLPLDGSERAQAAIEPAAQLIAALASPEQGQLHLTQAVVLPAITEESGLSEREAIIYAAGQYLESVEEQIRGGTIAPPVMSHKVKLTWSVTIDDDIAAAIVRLAEDGEEGLSDRCDIIAMATHGYTGQQRWTVGSVTERVLRSTRMPLLIVRSV